MKKLTVLGLILVMAGAAFAENGLSIGGDAKTGLNIEKLGEDDTTAKVKHSDDGGTPGRVRLNFNWTKDNFQVKWRMQMNGDSQGNTFMTSLDNVFAYAYAMGDFFDNQFRVSLGKIGADHPFETGGNEVWTNVEDISGARFEFKPAAVAGLNIALLMPAISNSKASVAEYFSELGFGVRYENDALEAHVAMRFDGTGDDTGKQVGARAVWRLDAKFIDGVLPGLSLWANGLIEGIPTLNNVPENKFTTASWLYVKYAQEKLTGAELRLGLDTWGGTGGTSGSSTGVLADFHIKPVFSYKLTDWAEAGLLLDAVLNLAYADELQVVENKDPSAFRQLQIEPSVNFTLPGGFSIKPVYDLYIIGANAPRTPAIAGEDFDKVRIDHVFELRFTYSF
jgi:hypothetical protein